MGDVGDTPGLGGHGEPRGSPYVNSFRPDLEAHLRRPFSLGQIFGSALQGGQAGLNWLGTYLMYEVPRYLHNT